jgi:hypothetical protein
VSIEVGEAKERLNIFDFVRFGPVEDSLNFALVHMESIRSENESEILDGRLGELAFFSLSVELMLSEASEYFTDVFLVVFWVVWIDKDVIEINHNGYIEHVRKDVIDKMLESSRSIGQSERHNEPFKRAIASAERGLPFISRANANKMISVAKVDLRVDAGLARTVQEVRNKR